MSRNCCKISALQVRPTAIVSQAGVVQYGEPIELEAKLKVDLVVIGSVAVNQTFASGGFMLLLLMFLLVRFSCQTL